MTEHQTRRYTFKLYPNKAQTEALERQCVLLARLWNAALQEREEQWRREVERKGYWRKVKRPKDERPQGLGYYDQARAIKHIRADDAEYAAMSCASMELCLKALDLAFRAFWRRLKEGVPAWQAGYPKYKSVRRHRTIWHRDGSGWKLSPAGTQWKFYFKGVPGTIKARGRFPMDPDEIRTMEIVHRDGAWMTSVVVYQQPRRAPGATPLRIAFDLLDRFAVVKNAANGECLPGLTPNFLSGEGRITELFQGIKALSDDGAGELAGDGRDATGALVARVADGAGDCDAIQSARDRKYKKGSYRWRRETARIAKRKAKEARVRKEALHHWTTRVVEHASEITVSAPSIKEHTQSGRGDQFEWGGAVKTVAALNRNTLEQAPAMAIAMLEYKAAEAGIPFRQVTDEETKLSVGRDVRETVKKTRKARRKLKEAA
ncbi:MAG: transposase [Pseudomonadota bacterium]